MAVIDHTRRTVIGAALALAAMPGSVAGQASKNVATQTGTTDVRIRCAFDQQIFTATLFDGTSSRDLASMLPLDLTIEDYANNEKIAYLPRKLAGDGSSSFSDEAPGDLCYYAPWGNLVFFYAGYRYSRGLIRLGRLDEGIQPLLAKGRFALRIELLP